MSTIVPPEELTRFSMTDANGDDVLLGQPKPTNFGEEFILQCEQPDEYPCDFPNSLFLTGPSGTGKGTLVKIIANESGCTMFKPGAKFFDKKPERLDSMVGIAKEVALETGRLSIVFLDEVDGLFSTENRSKVNAMKMIWEDECDVQGVLIVCTTNHYARLTDEGLNSRLANVVEFDRLTFDVQKALIIRNFKSMKNSGQPLQMSDSDWNKLKPSITNDNGHTLRTWCNNVSRKVITHPTHPTRPTHPTHPTRPTHAAGDHSLSEERTRR